MDEEEGGDIDSDSNGGDSDDEGVGIGNDNASDAEPFKGLNSFASSLSIPQYQPDKFPPLDNDEEALARCLSGCQSLYTMIFKVNVVSIYS